MKHKLKQWLRNSCVFEFLQRVRYRFSPIPRRSKKLYITDIRVFPIQKGVVLETYRLGPPFGPCPAASVYIHDDEVMRFDCLGATDGHFHVNLTQALFCPDGERARLYFPNGTVADHIENAGFQLRKNLDYARRQNYKRCVRAVRIDQARLDQVAEHMRTELLRIDREIMGTVADIKSP